MSNLSILIIVAVITVLAVVWSKKDPESAPVKTDLFAEIDSILAEETEKLGATLSKDRPDYPEELRTFEERRIEWSDGSMRKAIVIQPKFTSRGVNSELWNFIVLAWIDRERTYSSRYVTDQPFAHIKENIETLLSDAKRELSEIRENDLTTATIKDLTNL